jgi:hypothetical protein
MRPYDVQVPALKFTCTTRYKSCVAPAATTYLIPEIDWLDELDAVGIVGVCIRESPPVAVKELVTVDEHAVYKVPVKVPLIILTIDTSQIPAVNCIVATLTGVPFDTETADPLATAWTNLCPIIPAAGAVLLARPM